MKTLKLVKIVFICLGLSHCLSAFAETFEDSSTDSFPQPTNNIVLEKIEHEITQDYNPFSLIAYEPNYILPANYTSSPTLLYQNLAPDKQKIQRTDFKFQFSFKTPIWRNFFGENNALHLAYTQQSFWQCYNKSAFFRANNYQPEIFLENNVDIPLCFGWNLQLLTIGLVHQSNGRGGTFERSWNRVYLDATFSNHCWLVSLKPWHIISEKSISAYNPDIKHYLGHGRILISHNFGQHQVLSFIFYNNLESAFKRGSVQVSYSFPLIKKIRGYVQFFNGFGQSLLEYNHRTSAFGIGISFSDWL